MFTDINFILDNYNCDNIKIFCWTTIFLSISIFLNLITTFKSFKAAFKKKQLTELSSTHYINIYSELCFATEMYGLGKVLD